MVYMDLEKLSFTIRPEVSELVNEVEQICGQPIELCEVKLGPSDEQASASGGFKDWRPYIGINKIDEFDEHALAHEILHIKRFAEGAYICRSTSAGPQQDFANDLTNQTEHSVIFGKLEELGFTPRTDANEWYERKITELSESDSSTWGPVQETWVAFKAAAAFLLCESDSLPREYYELLDKKSRTAALLSDKILEHWDRANLLTNAGQITFYRHFMRIAKIPKGALFLVQFDVAGRRERSIEILT